MRFEFFAFLISLIIQRVNDYYRESALPSYFFTKATLKNSYVYCLPACHKSASRKREKRRLPICFLMNKDKRIGLTSQNQSSSLTLGSFSARNSTDGIQVSSSTIPKSTKNNGAKKSDKLYQTASFTGSNGPIKRSAVSLRHLGTLAAVNTSQT